MISTQFTETNAAPLRASPCTLAWDRCAGPDLGGYAVYYGIKGSATTNRLDAGLTNQVTLKNLLAFSNYVFSAVSYSAIGIESPRTAAMEYAPPAVSSVKLVATTNQVLRVCFQAGTNTACRAEYSPGLNPPQWQTLGSAIADADGKVTIADPLTGNPPRRFYRAAVP